MPCTRTVALGLAVLLGACSSNNSKADAPVAQHDAAVDAAGPESNCFDGIDNNGDGKIDCDDPTCAATAVCATATPAGWTGYDAIYDDVAAGAPTACATTYATSEPAGSAALSADSATCTACVCGAASAGACAPAGGTATVPAVTWARLGVACERTPPTPTAAVCAGDDCVPRPPTPFVGAVCVHQTGDVACPTPSAYSVRHVFYTSVDDTRGCAACVCGVPNGGACAAAGGGATGSAAPTGATTYCCTP